MAEPTVVPSQKPVPADAIDSVIAHLGDRVFVRYDRREDSAGQGSERQVFLEVVEGTLGDAEAVVSEDLVRAGYIVGKRREDANGARQLYRAREGKPIRTLAREKGVGPALKDPRAVASIYLKQ
ncbi:hypothetical protein [Marilutibacter spongiae]|uniref:Uncharacterized protein n=1 Tax=Marilutibacter spongiae TaxID=2025720 RepID=A0A7W3TIP3_9GAMM|nr:hypothetical protein [Lysobacter spongiae]MBB1059032.1 hypothetical protein [Lysobacter spongiae]